MEKNILKRSYNLPQNVVELWEHFHRPSKDYSPSVAGAFLVWMGLPPDVREEARHLAHANANDEAVEKIYNRLCESVKNQILNRWFAGMDHQQLEEILGLASQAAKKVSQKR